jgi:hypothetical protein
VRDLSKGRGVPSLASGGGQPIFEGMNPKRSHVSTLWLTALLALNILPWNQALAAGSPLIIVPAPVPDTGAPTIPVPGGPGQGNVANPSYLNPAPQNLTNSQQLQLKAYRNQLNQQQQDLQLQQSQRILSPNQQQRLYQTQQELGRVNQMLTAPAGPVFTMPSPSLSVGPSPLIPAH